MSSQIFFSSMTTLLLNSIHNLFPFPTDHSIPSPSAMLAFKHILIGTYHEMSRCLANYDNSLKMWHHKLAHETIFLTPSLIGSINDRIYILTNQEIVLIGLIVTSPVCMYLEHCNVTDNFNRIASVVIQ